MKKFKKILSLLLIVVMLVGCFTGCKDKDTKTNEVISDEENRIDDKYGTCYQVFIYSFCDSNDDGIGDINGLISKLDYIADLGFTSIWLLPFNQSTTYHKYDVVDYYSIDSEYGTMEDFEKLVEECNARNIDIVMDFVINHTSTQNEWFKEAKAYLQTLGPDDEPDTSVCPYVEYYNFVKSDTVAGGYSKVSGTTNWTYECVFWDQMPDLNLDSEAVRKEIEDIADFWIEKGVKGFRLDAALHYYEGNNEKSTEALKWFYDYVEGVDPEIYVVAEVWSNYSTLSQFYESGVDSLFNFTLGNSDGSFIKSINKNGNGECGLNLANTIVAEYEEFSSINPDYVDGVFLSNHDTGRAASFLAKKIEKTKIAAAIQILSTGCVFVYYGEELGMAGSGIDENKRAPMYWTDEDSADMTDGPANMEEQEHPFGSYETQKDDENSLYNYYKKAIHIRNKYPQIGRGVPAAMDSVMEQDGNLCALSKTYDGETIYVIYNINSEASSTVTVSKDTYDYSVIADSLCVSEEQPTLDGETLTIPAFGCVVLK